MIIIRPQTECCIWFVCWGLDKSEEIGLVLAELGNQDQLPSI